MNEMFAMRRQNALCIGGFAQFCDVWNLVWRPKSGLGPFSQRSPGRKCRIPRISSKKFEPAFREPMGSLQGKIKSIG